MINLNEELEIRYCKPDDFPAIFELLTQLWPDKELNKNDLLKVFNKGIESKTQKYICASIANNIVGFCSLTIKNNLWQAGNLGHIDELVVSNNYRGKGIGTRLIEKITEIAEYNKCKRIELDSAFFRKKAHDFYIKLGYENRAYLFSKKLP